MRYTNKSIKVTKSY